MDWNVHFVHCYVQYFVLQQMVVAPFRSDSWVALRKENADSENWTVSSKSNQCSSGLSCQEATVICVGRSLPCPVAKPYWRMRKDADLEQGEMKVFSLPLYNVIIVSGGAVLKAAVMCAVERWYSTSCFLWPSIPSVQHSASGTADLLWDTSCLLCWNVLPGWQAVCGALFNKEPASPSAQCYSHFCGFYTFCLGPFMWKSMPCSLNLFQSQLKSACVLPPSPLKVYREKTWLAWPAKVAQQQLIILASTFVSMWIGWWSMNTGSVMESALG